MSPLPWSLGPRNTERTEMWRGRGEGGGEGRGGGGERGDKHTH